MRKFVAFLDRNYPWIMVVVGIAMMIYLVISGINDRLDMNKTCSEMNLQPSGPIAYIKEKRFAICNLEEPILKEIK